jgi:FkbM family methyltransferase
MKIEEIKELYKSGQISKGEFIDRMYELHKVLFDYSFSLNDTEIAKIEIEDNKVILSSRATKYHKGGIKFYCDNIDKRITPLEAFNFGNYEASDSNMLYRIIEKDYTIFDIGGNIGWYTNHVASMLTKGIVYAFEPIPETFQKLGNNVALNGFKNIRINNFPLSDKSGPLTFYYTPLMPGAASAANITNSENIQKIECTTRTLDSYVAETNITRVDFIKCDVEGAELLVFKGAIETIKKYKPIIFTEMLRKWAAKFNYHPNDIVRLFEELGYSCFTADEGGLKAFSLVDEQTEETNFFFFHKTVHGKKMENLLGSKSSLSAKV